MLSTLRRGRLLVVVDRGPLADSIAGGHAVTPTAVERFRHRLRVTSLGG